MKKKFVAMLMSITMCLTMVGQAGAAVFEDADAAEGAAAAVLDVDAGAPAADMFETQAGVQEAEIPNTPAAASENVFQDAPEDVIIITQSLMDDGPDHAVGIDCLASALQDDSVTALHCQ